MEQRQIHLRDILTVLFKRKKFIIFFVVLVFALVFVGNYVWPPTYESTARVQIKRGRETIAVDPSVLKGVSSPMVQMSTYDVNTIIDLVYSNDVLLKVVKDTGLAGGQTGGLLQIVRGAVRDLQYALKFKTPGDIEQEAADELHKTIHVDPVKDSYVLELRCRMARADLAHQVLTDLIQVFKEKHREVYSTEELTDFFEKQVSEVKGELEKAQQALEKFHEEHDVIALEARQDLLSEEYTKNERLLAQLQESEKATQAVEGDLTDADIVNALSQETESTVVTEIQLRLFDKIVDRNKMTKTWGAAHPQVEGIKKEILELNQQLKDVIVRVREITEAKQEAIKGEISENSKLAAQLEQLDREVEMAGEFYETYNQKYKEAKIYKEMAAYSSGAISTIVETSQPTRPDNPISPRKLFNLVLALIGGIVGGVAIAFFLEYLDHGLKTPEDVEHYVQVSPLASFFRSPYEQLDPKESQRLSALLESAEGKDREMVLVASSVGGEGAHRVARALAEAYADDPDARTLLLDFMGDGLEPRPSGRGILDVLDGECSLHDVLSQLGGLYVVGRGSKKDCPSYVWNSDKMASLIEGLRGEFHRIIVHAAPVLQAHDALHLARYADAMLLVIRADSTRREVVQRAVGTLGEEAKQKIVGAVLTERKQVIPKIVYRRM